MNFILIDGRNNFRDDVRTRLMLDDERDVTLLTDLPSTDNLNAAVSNFSPEYLVIADNVVREMQEWNIPNIQIIGYVARSGSVDPFASYGIPSLGYIQSATHLLNLLEGDLPKLAAPTVQTAEQQQFVPSSNNDAEQVHQPIMTARKSASATPTQAQEKAADRPIRSSPPRVASAEEPIQAPHSQDPIYEASAENNDATNKQTPSNVQAEAPATVKERLADARAKKIAAENSAILQKQLEKKAPKAKVVTVYSAKGGVGKTTVSTELAVYLAMTSIGRGNCRVCLVDYNIDFGNVLSTLDFESNGQTLSYWAAEIKERIKNGEAPEDINYTRKEIEEHLQKMDLKKQHKAWLYSLIAPISHEDSFDIESDELEVILRNIAENGEFDFVICDTGNNTRDSSVIALEAADYVLLVATQDVSTAYCNDAFLSTMQKIKFDTNKIRLVVNQIMPYKYTQIAVKEIEQMFPYQCVARFHRNPDIIKANNCCEPVAYQPNHEFTKELRNIVAFLTGEEIPSQPEKKGFIQKLFGKKE